MAGARAVPERRINPWEEVKRDEDQDQPQGWPRLATPSPRDACHRGACRVLPARFRLGKAGGEWCQPILPAGSKVPGLGRRSSPVRYRVRCRLEPRSVHRLGGEEQPRPFRR